MNDPTTPRPKKNWTDPRLTRYGNVQDISESVGKTGHTDTGGMGMMIKTR